MSKLIFVGGVPASGKTTFARFLRDISYFKYIEVDLVYYAIAGELGLEPRSFANPKIWQKVLPAKLNPLKRKHYEAFIAGHAGDLVFEGLGVSFEADREIIRDLVRPELTVFFQKNIDYPTWCIQKGKEKDESSMREFVWLSGLLTCPESAPDTLVYHVSHV